MSQNSKPFVLSGYEEKLERDKFYEIKKTIIDIKLDFENRAILGKVTHSIVMNSFSVESIEMDATDMIIYSVSINGNSSKFFTYGEKLIIFGDFKAGRHYNLVITYKSVPRRGGYFVETDDGVQFWTQGEDMDNHSWFPTYDYPNMRSSYEIRVTVPNDYFVISNGHLDSKIEGEHTTFIYKEDFPFPSYLVSIIAGKFSEMRQEWEGIPIISYFQKKYESLAPRSFQNTPDMMKFISEKTGVKYPYEKYSQTCVSEFTFGGMENLSATTLTDRTLHDELAHLDYQSDSLVCHELAHQWFGDYVTCKDWSHAWLNEGFATYIALIYMEKLKGKDEFLVEVFKHREAYLNEFKSRYSRSIVENRYMDPAELFDRHLYQKASLVLRYLNYLVGEENFWKAINYYLNENKGKSVGTEALRSAFHKITGLPMEKFFHDFIYLEGHPEIHVKVEHSKERVKVIISQKGNIYSLKLPIRVYKNDKVEETEMLINNAEEIINIDDSGYKAISVDPEYKVLKVLEYERPKEEAYYIIGQGLSPLERADAALEISKYGPSELEFLNSSYKNEKFWFVKGKIAESIAKIGGKRAAEILMEFLKDPDYLARKEVVKASANLQYTELGDYLMNIYLKEKAYGIRGEILFSLAKINGEKFSKFIVEHLDDESYDDIIRTTGLKGLGEIGDRNLIDVIKKYTGTNYNWQTRAAAVLALSKYYWKDMSLADTFHTALKDKYFAVRLNAVNAIRNTGDTRLIQGLRGYLDTETDGRVRRAIREALEYKNSTSEELNELRNLIEKQSNKLKDLEPKVNSLINKL